MQVEDALSKHNLFERFFHAKNGAEGYHMLVNNPVDLILCDVVMPDMDGFKFLSLKGAGPDFIDIPVIMLTGKESVDDKVKGLEAGASDYLTKPFHPEELLARVKVHVKLRQLQRKLREQNDHLEKISRTDPLTQLVNRRYFMERFAIEYSRMQRYGTPLSYVMIDVDHFKEINDDYGHLAGDRILQRIAEVMNETVRSHDLVGRYGGEEFAILLPQCDAEDAARVAERCREKVAAVQVPHLDAFISATISVGVVTLPRSDVRDIDGAIQRADNALYDAKTAGRNRVVGF